MARWRKAVKDDWKSWRERRTKESPIIRGIGLYSKIIKSVSPHTFFVTASATTDETKRLALSDRVVVAWTVLLACLFLIPSATAQSLGMAIFITAVASFRVLDILSYTLDLVRQLAHKVTVYEVARSALLNLVNVLHIILAFGLIDYAWLSSRDFVSNGWILNGSFSYLYLSWTTLFTIGSGLTPSTGPAQGLVMAEVGTGLITIAVSLAVLVGSLTVESGGAMSLYKPREDGDPEDTSRGTTQQTAGKPRLSP